MNNLTDPRRAIRITGNRNVHDFGRFSTALHLCRRPFELQQSDNLYSP